MAQAARGSWNRKIPTTNVDTGLPRVRLRRQLHWQAHVSLCAEHFSKTSFKHAPFRLPLSSPFIQRKEHKKKLISFFLISITPHNMISG